MLHTVLCYVRNCLKFQFHRDDWPQSTSMNSMDIWQIMCYLNVFFVLVEYCLVLWLSKGVSIGDINLIKISTNIQTKNDVNEYIYLFE